MTEARHIWIHFQGDNAPLGPSDDEARSLIFPDGGLAREIEYDGRTWWFSHIVELTGPNDPEPTVDQYWYVERKPRLARTM